MNDRFKFRVWDKRRNKFIESPEPTPMLQANGLLAYFKDAEYMNNYVIQFCTGLKDKNGKLIYESDIVKFNYDTDEIIAVVSWDDNEGQIGYYLNTTDYFKDKYVTDYDFYKNDYEVIGNIYENKELLEEE